MRTTLSAILLLVLAATALAQQNSPDSHFDGNSWWAHVKFLADDSLEGRDTGSSISLSVSINTKSTNRNPLSLS